MTSNFAAFRVRYAFAFRAGSEDLIFISVHLKPDPGPAKRARRAHELASIAAWIAGQTGAERDYVILGDMNLENCAELKAAMPPSFISLNGDCLSTTPNPESHNPYDHVMLNPAFTRAEIPPDFRVIDLVEAMRPSWHSTKPYLGDSYVHGAFRPIYSDHDPVVFTVAVDGVDDD